MLLVPVLPSNDHLQQVEDYVYIYCYIYKIMSEVVLLLTNTDHLQLVKEYVRGCP